MTPEQIARWPGKSAPEGGDEHPAVYHMLDVAAVAEALLSDHPDRELLTLLIALHDLGKIGESFRTALRGTHKQTFRHWEVTEAWLEFGPIHDLLLGRLGGGSPALQALIGAISGHHGKPPSAQERQLCMMRETAGADATSDALEFVKECLDLWPEARLTLRAARAKQLSWWLAGLTTVADWVGSNVDWFPARPAGLSLAAYFDEARKVAPVALRQAGLIAPTAVGGHLFDFDLRPMQVAARRLPLPDGPMVAFLEDETGAGKTEAAFLLLQRMLLAGKGQGAFIALPTMATADAMFVRAREVVCKLYDAEPSLTLAHGRAGLSVAFREVQNTAPGSDAPVCGPWLADSRRRALLADIGIGTIDQALLAVLPTRFATLRNWGLARKVLIVDEVHELSEPYIAHELATLLRLHAMQGGSAILLTATLPLGQRAHLSQAFEEGADRTFSADDDRAYPSLSIPNGAAIRDLPAVPAPKSAVLVERLASADEAVGILAGAAARGAACVWVRNAVDDAIAGVEALRERGIAADLLHARFAFCDRKWIEAEILTRFGKHGVGRSGRVLVATQVVESSLDLDFDVMVSDLAPVAALIQRAGRLWRHMDIRPVASRTVPAPILHVVSPDPAEVRDDAWLRQVLDGGAYVYPLAEQWRTAQVLFAQGRIDAPHGLRALIEAVHGEGTMPVPQTLERAELEAEGEGHARRNRALHNTIRIQDGYRDGGGGSDDVDYPTRLGEPLRILMLARFENGTLRPWADGETPVEAEMLSEVSASFRRLATCDLPDQEGPEIAALKAGWPEWKRAAVTVCPVDTSGSICMGLRYVNDRGLFFTASD